MVPIVIGRGLVSDVAGGMKFGNEWSEGFRVEGK